jgi:hypothetical protein
MKRSSAVLALALAPLLCAACNRNSSSSSGAAAGASATPGASGSPAAAPTGNPTAVLGGADWRQVFAGEPPLQLPFSWAGGQATGMGDDYTMQIADPSQATPQWKRNEAGGGSVYWSATKKAVVVTNINLKQDPTQKSIDLWSKSALIKDLKQTAGPEYMELGPTKAPVLAGAGTCTLSTGEPASLYWFDGHSVSDFAHNLYIVIVAKDAPEADKQVALSVLRGLKYTPKGKPTAKKG